MSGRCMVWYINTTSRRCMYRIPYFYFYLLIISHLDDHIHHLTIVILRSIESKRQYHPDDSRYIKMPSTNSQNTLPIILILLLALMLITMPANAQNPIANSYFCRMQCDAHFNLCVNQMGKFVLNFPFNPSLPSHHHPDTSQSHHGS